MLLQILVHTPKWVFALFAALLWLGIRQMSDRTPSRQSVGLLALGMTVFSLIGALTAFPDTGLALLAWSGLLLVSAWLLLRRPLPTGTGFDAEARRFHLPGSAVPLLLMMGIFFTKYAVGITLSLHAELAHLPAFALPVCAAYGFFSGIFLGRAARLLRLAGSAAPFSPIVKA